MLIELGLIAHVMRNAIYLDDCSGLVTIEIYDKRLNRVLATKPQPQRFATQALPQQNLGQ